MKNPIATRRRVLMQFATGVASLGASGLPAFAQSSAPLPKEVANELANAVYTGAARMRFFTFDVYDSRLWVAAGFKAAEYAQHAFALELSYLRSLSGSAIAERSLKEMRRVGTITPEQEQRWLKAMKDAFPDVKDGDRIVGVHAPGVGARFWYNGQSRAVIADPEFSRYFFGIWLSDNTSEPKLRTSLLERAPQ